MEPNCCVAHYEETSVNDADMTEEPEYAYELYSSHCASSRLNTFSYGEKKLQNRGWMLFEERVDLNFGLLDKLLASGLLNEVQYEEIKASQSSIIGWKKLSEYIQRNSLYDLVLAIQMTMQQHLLNYAWNSESYNPKFGGDWPLTDHQMMTLNINQEVLVELMEMSPELVEQLYSLDVLNKRHKGFICGQLSELKRSETFLDILRRRSFRDYKETIKCLRASNNKNKNIAEILEGGVVARIFCSVTSSKSCPVNRSTSKAIFERYPKKLNRRTLHEEDCKFQLKKIGLIGVGFDNGVVLYFNFKKKDDFENLEKVFDNGEINTFAEADFNNLLSRDETPITVLLHWTYYDRNRCGTYISCGPYSDTCINKLPMEVLEIILTKAYALYFYRVQPRPRDKELFAMLSSVTRNWQKTITRRWFKASLNRRLSPYFVSITKRQTIIRSNRQYFVKNMEPSSNLIRRLEQVGCLTTEEANYIESLQDNSEKNHELLNIARCLSFEKHFAFIESLHVYGQFNVANVLEKGGVVLKAKAACAGTSTDNEFTKRLNENIFAIQGGYNELGDCTKLLFVQIPTELEILGAQQLGRRRGREYVVIWLWCKLQKSLDQLCKLSKSNELLQRLDGLITYIFSKSTETFSDVLTALRGRTLVPQFLQTLIINKMQFQIKVAVRRLSAIFCGKFYLPPKSRALTSLDDKVYVLTDHMISVHQYMAPYARQSKTVFPSAESPTVHPGYHGVHGWFIEVCNHTKRIYVARPYDRHVWKLTTPECNLEVWMHYTAILCSLSVTSNGHVLIINAERRANDAEYCLEIFTKDAALVHHVNLGISMNYSKLEFCSALEISPGNVAINCRWSLIVKAVDFATDIADPNHIQYPFFIRHHESIESIALYSERRLIILLSNKLATFDSRLNVEIISNSVAERAQILHYRKDKRQAMIWTPARGSVHIYTLQYDGEDLFVDV